MSQKIWKLMYCNSGTSPQNPKFPFATRLVAGKRSRIELVDAHNNHVSCLASGDYADSLVKLILAELDS